MKGGVATDDDDEAAWDETESPDEASPDAEDEATEITPEAFRGRVALIASPIGNLMDLTIRALERLKASDVICCEDTRHSLRLFQRHGIGRKELLSLHDRNEDRRIDEIIARARSGAAIAVISDAGMPTVSDPGFRLTRACVAAGVPVDVLPGPSAVLTALAGSGLPTDAFYFGGFLPPKSGRREMEMREALERSATSIFFESPHRIAKTLRVIATLDPDRPVCVARELTKKFETFHRGRAEDLAADFEKSPRKGEMTLVVAGKTRRRHSE